MGKRLINILIIVSKEKAISADSICDDCYYETEGRHCLLAQVFSDLDIQECKCYRSYSRLPSFDEYCLN